jgi:PAS domain S-box-containing protein
MTLARRITIFVIIVLPALLASVYSYINIKQSTIDRIYEERRNIASLSARVLYEKLGRLNDIGLSFSTRPVFCQYVDEQKWDDAIALMKQVPKDFSYIDRIFLADTAGTMMADVPFSPELKKKNYARRDWYSGPIKNWQPYLSEVYKRFDPPHKIITAFAIPIKNGIGIIRGILVLQVDIAELLEWSKQVSIGNSGFLYVVDHKGNIAANPQYEETDSVINYSSDPAVQKALRGEKNVEVLYNPIAKENRLSAYEQIPDYGWAVIVQQEADAALSANNSLRLVFILYAVFILFAVISASFITREINRRVKAEEARRQLNEELEERVKERTAEIVKANEVLQLEMNERKRTEEKVRESEQRFRLVVESAPNAILMVDQQGKIALVNSKAEEYFGYSRNELIGEPIELLVPQRHRTKHRNHEIKYLSDPAVRQMVGRELTAQRKDGAEFPVEIGLNPISTAEGNMVLCSIVDITESKRAEEALRFSERQLSLVYSNVSDIIFYLGVEQNDRYRFLSINPAFFKATGLTESQVMGKLVNEIIPEPSLTMVLGKYKEAIAEKKTVTWEETSVYPSGTKHGEVSVTPIFDNDGRCTNLIGAVHDITERKRAEKEKQKVEQRYRTTLDHMIEGCQIISYDWRYLYVNDALVKQGRRSREELLGHTMMEMYPGIDSSDFFVHLRHCMEQRIPHSMENEFTYPDGTKGWFYLSIEPVPEGIFILSEDITKEKRLGEELRRHQEHLEELVVERTAQLEAANKELEAFSYSVSHDLRTPLRHIDGFVELLQKHSALSLDEKSRRYFSFISDAAKQMGTLIDDLLVFSRMGKTEMRKARVNIEDLVKKAITNFARDTEARNIHWEIDTLPVVEADPSMLSLVFQNLISNAIKYTRTRERAEIRVGCVKNDSEQVLFVSDNGVGFDMKYADKLFGVFQRLHRAEEFEGTGIGLANVRRIIQRHKGRTWAEGKINEGATFYFSLPTS